ncbi:MAG: hypothetical protein U0599_28475 [Vicinamibacteria bacterium]
MPGLGRWGATLLDVPRLSRRCAARASSMKGNPIVLTGAEPEETASSSL